MIIFLSLSLYIYASTNIPMFLFPSPPAIRGALNFWT